MNPPTYNTIYISDSRKDARLRCEQYESSTRTASENGEDQTAVIAGILSSSEKSIVGRLGTGKSRTKRTKDTKDPQL